MELGWVVVWNQNHVFLHAQMSAGAQAGQLAQNPELLTQMMQVSGV